MNDVFTQQFLSRASIVAAIVFAYCAWMVYSLNRDARPNRVAVVFNVLFAAWAGAASFWYGADDPERALELYRAFSWTWALFPPLILHFSLSVTDNPILAGRFGRPLLIALYAPGAALCFLTPIYVIAEPVYRGGYWMLAVNANAAYAFFVCHYLAMVVASGWIIFAARRKAADRRTAKRLSVLGRSYVASSVLGFTTDTAFLMLGVDFPNMAILWILILSLGMIYSMKRYGLLSILPPGEAVSVLESLGEFVIYVDEGARLVWANPSAIAAIGATGLNGARGMRCDEFLRGDVERWLKDPSVYRLEPRGVSATLGPDSIPVSLWVHPVGESGSEGSVLTAVDLRAEFANARTKRRLADADRLLDEFIARSLDGIVLTDADGLIVRWNYPMVAMTGIEAEEALGSHYWDVLTMVQPESGVEPARMRRAIRAMLAMRDPARQRRVLETVIWRRDGSRRIVQNDLFPIPLADGTILAIIARDVTDERRLAEENIERIRKLDHAQKMEAVGTLSGGIAHDFNNTLAGIVGAASLIRQGIESGSVTTAADVERELELIERASKRAASSVRRLLTLTRKRSPESLVFRLDEALGRVEEFASRSMDQSVSLNLRRGMPEAWVRGDAGQLEQLFLNLIVNAEHAVTIMRPREQRRGGNIDIALYRFVPDRDFLLANPNVAETEYWALSVKDDGVGVPRHIQRRIFDPFYTTKPSEASSGLGLAMVHAIATQHGGFVDLRSEPGEGAEFVVYLPVAPACGDACPDDAAPRRGTGAVLIVDDDDIPRETAMSLLGALGYGAVVASSGEEAYRLFEERPSAWKAALLDLRLGDCSGDELAGRMRKLRPDLPVVIASGFHEDAADDSDWSGYAGEGGAAFAMLRKPYTMGELSRAIAEAGA
ncbi:MAG TPA: ATP-binding protein [Spirochaetales bacterium]|nr:ATP-binding protein [Spirochaetales bacterium]